MFYKLAIPLAAFFIREAHQVNAGRQVAYIYLIFCAF